ncbi:hypothetical protein L914_11477 [Phytophthora nicotianae]|uniref:Uncharacterized protein n=1 Tax=Phytophthora nicotianae TaxID=4792 RepID=W2N2Y1_PHYNI|nr:hypothetical protein L914_11477 [Phytophthora nicotianae]
MIALVASYTNPRRTNKRSQFIWHTDKHRKQAHYFLDLNKNHVLAQR